VSDTGPALLARLQEAQLNARKAQDKARLLLLGTIVADVRNREIEVRRPLTDDDVIDVLRKGIKKRRESVDMYRQGQRADLADIEEQEVRVLEEWLPVGASADEIRAAVLAAIGSGATSVGAVMGRVMPQFKGRADGTLINTIVRDALNA
jgi:hypothetical protein